MPDVVYSSLRRALLRGAIDLEKDRLGVMLVTSAYQPHGKVDAVVADVTGEVEGEGYERQPLTGQRVFRDTKTADEVFDANDLIWERASLTARGAVIYQDTGDPATSLLIYYADFRQDITCTNGPFALGWNADGILVLE